jgi:hypothetical protein
MVMEKEEPREDQVREFLRIILLTLLIMRHPCIRDDEQPFSRLPDAHGEIHIFIVEEISLI